MARSKGLRHEGWQKIRLAAQKVPMLETKRETRMGREGEKKTQKEREGLADSGKSCTKLDEISTWQWEGEETEQKASRTQEICPKACKSTAGRNRNSTSSRSEAKG